MAVHVSFGPPGYIGNVSNLVLGDMRASEAVTVGNPTTSASEDGEFAWVVNAESSAVYVAHGSAPDASATTSGAETSARYVLPSGQGFAIAVKTGDKIDTAAVS